MRYIACSNFSGWHLMKSLAVSDRYGWSRYVGHQVYYSLLGREYEWELMPLALDQGVGALVWSPLGWGRLTGKIRRGQPLPAASRLHQTADKGPQVADERLYKVVDALEQGAKETEKSVPQVALNWLLQRPTVSTIIIGARNEEQLRQNLAAEGWSLSAAQSRGARSRQRTGAGLSVLAPVAVRRAQPAARLPLTHDGRRRPRPPVEQGSTIFCFIRNRRWNQNSGALLRRTARGGRCPHESQVPPARAGRSRLHSDFRRFPSAASEAYRITAAEACHA